MSTVMDRKLNTMPLASTTPMSTPMRNCMHASDRKPKKVTAADDATTENERRMASTMASPASSVRARALV